MAKFTDRKGETNRAANGQLMTIIAYRSASDIDIQFEDKVIVYNKCYSRFKSGKIRNPRELDNSLSNMCKKHNVNYTHALNYRKEHPELSNIEVIELVKDIDNKKIRKGETVRAKNGLLMKIIEYRRCDDIDIQFEDGEIVRHKQYANFQIGNIRHPNINAQAIDNTNEIVLQNCGQYAKIIKYINTDNIDIQFTDGTILRDKTYKAFKNGHYRNPNYHLIVIEICKRYGISCNEFYKEKCKNIELSDNEIIKKLLSHTNTITYVKIQCKLNNINYAAVKAYIDRNKDIPYTEIIEKYIRLKNCDNTNKLLEYCNKLKLNYEVLNTYKRRHSGLTDESVILHYRPDCYINCLGELVIPT